MRPVERSRSLHAGCFIKRETVTVWPQFPALGWRVFSLRGTVQLSSGREEEGCCSRLLWSSAKPRVVALLRRNAPCLCPAEQHLGRNSRSTAPCCLCLPACLPAWAVPGLPVPLTSSLSFHFSISPFLPPHVHHRVECRIISEYRFY